ncbi:response regulator transcription factor [Microbacterium esteraromaticum]|uniref:Response regulator transcription factor n=1 Tax=Microbacterium esteraromaticum TaxID=57043 RepID=A0A939DU00_9MICO|nr:response regulator transcription factor [Microbacterium esteraromaticum]MBN8204974.1 response regulator transcription factor [Microbacterium esteraromaticum]MBN8415128.1 response regulator transcription factor [Microbacterium esteraromaticum]MBY6059935.1 response regulator transcription factor [Microbacterium esteraromaticum]
MKLLIADDDPQLVRALRITLAAHGYDVVAAPDGAAAIQLAAQEHPDIVLLDLGMPQLDGVQVIHALRGWTTVPIIVVSGRTGSADKVDALDAGADDYVTKPFQIDELLARLRALSRRAGAGAGEATVAFGDVVVDLAAKSVARAGAHVHLTPTEWRMLEHLVRHPGALVTRQELLRELWGTEQATDTGYLRLYMSQLRKKLEADPSAPVHLLTEQGMGYRLVL